MIEILNTIFEIVNGLSVPLSEAGFEPYRPDETPRGELPVITENDRSFVTFDRKEGDSLRIEYKNKTVGLLYSSAPAIQSSEGDYSRLSLSLLDPEEADSRDVKYVIEEFSETLSGKFSGGKKPKANKKLPQTVSKTAVKNGAFYDAATFGNRFTTIYPELREQYKENIGKYGEFLPEDFFKNYGTPAVMATIKENNPQKMKKLFNLLNETYDNGINEVQSLIVVSVLGNMYDKEHEQLLANCTDYMNNDLCVNVIRVNKYLGKSGSKGMRMRLENPPRYKVKKAKRNGLFSKLMNGGQPQQ